MNQLTKVLMLIVCAFTLTATVGCKSSEEKAQDNAKSAVAEYNSKMDKLKSMGTPNASWTMQELASYKNLAKRLIALGKTLKAQNGQNGVSIGVKDGGSFEMNERYIRERLIYVQAFIDQKMADQQVASRKISEQMDKVVADLDATDDAFVESVEPVNGDSTVDSLEDDLADIQDYLNYLDEKESEVKENLLTDARAKSVLKRITTTRKNLNKAKGQIDQAIQEKNAASDEDSAA